MKGRGKKSGGQRGKKGGPYQMSTNEQTAPPVSRGEKKLKGHRCGSGMY